MNIGIKIKNTIGWYAYMDRDTLNKKKGEKIKKFY
jgi:hypothetical protein